MKPKSQSGDKKYILDVESPPVDATAPPAWPSTSQSKNVYGLPQGVVPVVASWAWDHMIASTISAFMCSLCGLPALVFSLLAYIDHRTNLHASARSRRRTALILALIGIGVSMLIYSLVVAAWCYWAYQSIDFDGKDDMEMTSEMPGWQDSHERLMDDGAMGSHESHGSDESHEGPFGGFRHRPRHH